jgi:peptide/nickel transport system substrate-binding protein
MIRHARYPLLIALVITIAMLLGVAIAQKTLRIGIDVDPINLDPAQMSHMEAHRFVALIYPTLLRYDTELRLVPHLAESYRIVDERTYEFVLRQDVMFHHGRQMVADDVKFSIERILDPAVPSPEAFELQPIEEVVIIDDFTLRIVTREPFAPILHGLTFGLGIHARESVEEHGDLRFFGSGTGPFRLVEYIPDSIVVLERFDDYFGPRPALDRIEYHIIPDAPARTNALRAGDIDVARYDDAKAIAPLRRDANLTVSYTGAPRILHYHLNHRRAPFDDARVRLAISCAIDRDAIAALVFLGDARPTGPIPPSMGDWAIPTSDMECYTQDLERARSLLAEAGYPNGFTSRMTGTTRFPVDIEVGQVMQQQLAEVGITMEIEQVEWGDLLDMWITRFDFDTLLITSFTGRDPDANFGRRFLSTSTRNAVGYDNPTVDDLIERSRTTIDPEARFEIFRELQQIITTESAKVFVVEYPFYEVYRNEVQNWVTHPMGMHYHLDQVDVQR